MALGMEFQLLNGASLGFESSPFDRQSKELIAAYCWYIF